MISFVIKINTSWVENFAGDELTCLCMNFRLT